MTQLNQALRGNAIPSHDVANIFINPVKKNTTWRVEQVFTCPLVGFCLTPVEQRRLLKQASINAEKFDAFVIHELLVNGLQVDSPFSQRILRFFERKFENQYAYARKLDDKAFLDEWRKAFTTGEYIGLIWIAATRQDLMAQTKTKVYGDVHMSMHGTAEAQIQAQQRIEKAEKAAERFRLRISDLRNTMQEQKQTVDAVTQQNRVAQAEITRLRQHVQRLEEKANTNTEQPYGETCPLSGGINAWSLRGPLLEKENEALRHALAHTAEREKRLQEQLAAQMHDLHEYTNSAVATMAENATAIMNEVSAEMAEACPLSKGNAVCHKTCGRAICNGDECPQSADCPRRVLIVGGIARMEALYRDLIERNGGTLEYHDGAMRSGTNSLKRSLQRADVVLCLVNCNSHSACLKVKDFAKKYRKRLHMLHNGSLSTVSRVLQESSSVH
ncbi:MAG: DUF2325 domain-containing protein [Pseudomonadota bacterium]